jgi:hypothetical protein
MPDKQEFTLYNGEVVLTFAEKSHRYKVSDSGSKPEHCPSVTTILNVLNKPALVEWGVKCACNDIEDNLRALFAGSSFTEQQILNIVARGRTAHDRIREEAAEIGTNVHDYLAQYWRAKMADKTYLIPHLPLDDKVENCIYASFDWFKEHDLRPIRVEEFQYSRKLKICGRPDWIGYVDGTLSVLDYKSTRQLWPELPLQMSAYAMMHNEEFGEQAYTRYGLRLDKESGQFEARKYSSETYEYDVETFKACFQIYDRLKTLRRKPKKEDYLAEL